MSRLPLAVATHLRPRAVGGFGGGATPLPPKVDR